MNRSNDIGGAAVAPRGWGVGPRFRWCATLTHAGDRGGMNASAAPGACVRGRSRGTGTRNRWRGTVGANRHGQDDDRCSGKGCTEKKGTMRKTEGGAWSGFGQGTGEGAGGEGREGAARPSRGRCRRGGREVKGGKRGRGGRYGGVRVRGTVRALCERLVCWMAASLRGGRWMGRTMAVVHRGLGPHLGRPQRPDDEGHRPLPSDTAPVWMRVDPLPPVASYWLLEKNVIVMSLSRDPQFTQKIIPVIPRGRFQLIDCAHLGGEYR